MIIARTSLRKLPTDCSRCRMAYLDSTYKRRCGITGRLCPMEPGQEGNLRYTKPGWCPVIEIKEEIK